MERGKSLVSVETAIKLLRPGAVFELYNTIFMKWEHELPPPSWDEINDMMKKIEEFVNTNELPDVVYVE